MTKPLCIYHGNCADGFGAAWAVREALGEDQIDFHPGIYQDDPPDVTGRDVIFVDFSYKRPVIEKMVESARRILVLDHHKSAAEDLGDAFLNAAGDGFTFSRWSRHHNGGAMVYFDMDRSGAGIAWDFFHDAPRPALIDHIEDRDLWRFKLPGTREIQAALFSYPYDFKVWDDLMDRPVETLRQEGVAIERKHHKDVAELVGVCQRYIRIGGYEIPAASLPYTLTSDAGHMMCMQPYDGTNDLPPFAACYWDTPDGRVFSLRSTGDGMDVSEIAKQYGGGGHRNAAGFRVPPDHELATIW